MSELTPELIICKACAGSGKSYHKAFLCPVCKGTGAVSPLLLTPDEFKRTELQDLAQAQLEADGGK